MPLVLPTLRLRTLLLAVNLLVLAVPLASIYGFRLYENELVRQTEAELIAQGAYISAFYKHELKRQRVDLAQYGAEVATPKRSDEKYSYIAPTVEIATLHAPRPDARKQGDADTLAAQAGAAIWPQLEEAMFTTLAGLRVLDYRGVVVAGREEVGWSLAHVEEVQKALSGDYAALLRQRISDEVQPVDSISRNSDRRLFIAMPIMEGSRVVGVVHLSRSPRSTMKALYENKDGVLVAAALVVGVTVLLALVMSRAIGRPIHALIMQTQRVARGEKNVRPIAHPATRELALLSQHIAQMADTIEARSDYIRNFAMHVSHEFKTPLTAIQGAIELIQEHGATMPPEQFEKFLANTLKDTARLKVLVTRLLELARADVMQPRDESCDLATVIRRLQSDYQDKYITIEAQGNTKLAVPEEVAHAILSNLVENSRQHGATRVSIAPIHNRLMVEDNGAGISPANAEKLFTPFFTTRRESGGTGLGLAIVRSLLAAYHADIRHVPSDEGARFDIRFPETTAMGAYDTGV